MLYKDSTFKRLLITSCMSAVYVLLLVASKDLGGALLYFMAFLVMIFIASKKIEGCSGNTLKYYSNTLTKMLETIQKNISVILKIISSCCLICFSPFRSTICIGDEISKIIFVINTSRWNNI